MQAVRAAPNPFSRSGPLVLVALIRQLAELIIGEILILFEFKDRRAIGPVILKLNLFFGEAGRQGVGVGGLFLVILHQRRLIDRAGVKLRGLFDLLLVARLFALDGDVFGFVILIGGFVGGRAPARALDPDGFVGRIKAIRALGALRRALAQIVEFCPAIRANLFFAQFSLGHARLHRNAKRPRIGKAGRLPWSNRAVKSFVYKFVVSFRRKLFMHLTARPSGPLTGRVRPPGDKSISHRALLFGALAQGTTEIEGLLEGDDVLRTAAAMAAFGAPASRSPDGRWTIRGRGADGFAEPTGPIDFGNSGTGVRLTMGAASRFPILAVYTGDPSLSGRPMRRVLEPLAAMGVDSFCRQGGLLPAAVRGKAGLSALTYQSPTASAQVKSAVLLAGLGADGVTSVTEPAPSRDHTERMLAAFGASVSQEALAGGQARASVTGGAQLMGQRVQVPADPSSAAFLAVAALICAGSEVLLPDVCLNPQRAGLYQTLTDMGAMLAFTELATSGGEPVGTLHLKASPGLKAARPPAARMPAMIDEVPILAVLAAFAEGETVIVGAEELRVKESDRIALTVAGLRACGVEAEERPDGLVVHGRGPGSVRGGALVETEGDHRIAMSFLVLGLAAQQEVTVNSADMIATSFPGFASLMAQLGAEIIG